MTKPTPFWKRLAWMAGLWVTGVTTLAAIARHYKVVAAIAFDISPMQFEAIAPVFLVLAIALSWPRSIAVFRPETTNLFSTAPLTMVASAVSLSGLGLAFSGKGLWFGVVIVATGMLLGAGARALPALISVSLSAVSFCVYLEFR